jgi:uncharacterized integral membrane protein
MLRLVPVVFMTMAFVAFGWANASRVSLNFVVGVTEVPLIFLLLTAFATGAVVVFINAMVKDAERRVIARKMRTAVRRAELQQLEVE